MTAVRNFPSQESNGNSRNLQEEMHPGWNLLKVMEPRRKEEEGGRRRKEEIKSKRIFKESRAKGK